jgi:GTP-binding protein SAR1
MFVWDSLMRWLDVLWTSLGLAGKQGQVVLLGLDNAGKTTLLHRLRTGRVQQHAFPPTDRPSGSASQRFSYLGVSLAAWDLGGHEVVRHLWADYVGGSSQNANNSAAPLTILFVVDAADVARVEEAGYELDHLVHDCLLHERDADHDDSDLPPPVAIFCNKCDVEGALAMEEILLKMDFPSLQAAYPADRLAVFEGSVWQGSGYPEAFRWMAAFF